MMSLKAVGYANANLITAKVIEHEVTLETIPGELLDTSTPSRLLLKFDVDKTEDDDEDDDGADGELLVKSYKSEADVSSFVFAALEDAVFLVGSATRRRFSIFHGPSLFLNRTAHLVVVDEETRDPVLVVRVKMPWDSKGGKEIQDSVLGQVYRYLLELRSSGHSAPFVVLSSFNESWLFWQDSEHSNNLVSSENKLGVLLDSPTKRGVPSTEHTPSSRGERKNEQQESKDVLSPDCVLFEEIPRHGMCRSKETYPANNLVPLLFTAILCGLSGIPHGPRSWQIGGHE